MKIENKVYLQNCLALNHLILPRGIYVSFEIRIIKKIARICHQFNERIHKRIKITEAVKMI